MMQRSAPETWRVENVETGELMRFDKLAEVIAHGLVDNSLYSRVWNVYRRTAGSAHGDWRYVKPHVLRRLVRKERARRDRAKALCG